MAEKGGESEAGARPVGRRVGDATVAGCPARPAVQKLSSSELVAGAAEHC